MEENVKKKLSYEELENIASQLASRLDEANGTINKLSSVLNRLPYLFKIVELGDSRFNESFVKKCADEIQEIMTIPDEPIESETKE